MTETRAIDARRSGDAVDVTAEAPAQRTRRRALVIFLSANVAQSAAALRFAQQEAERSQTLVQRGTGTVQRQQQASSTLQQEQARRKNAVEGVEAT
ncbi:hypothetical protein [Methylocystis echinoides]|uniref:hypothetical protein n=1 Tax=Methylocystis echinoides TaxID=29468 RepID=UPI003445E1C0